MKLADMKKEELSEFAMVEIAFLLMKEKNKPFEYYQLMDQVAELKGMTNEEVKTRISFLYTDLNIDGRFLALGDNNWGLRSWYPLEQVEEEITSSVAKPKKKSKALLEDDELLDEYEEDEFEDLEDELDELNQEEDEDEDEEEDLFDDSEEELEEFDDNDEEEDFEDEEEEFSK
ncbi:putative RNA polymerase [Bacillus sp. TS-2]|nr:putative RNA polymerase [Bacillus sp. TS-2]